MSTIDEPQKAQISGVTAPVTPQVQPTTANATSQDPLFGETSSTSGISTTDRTDAYVPSNAAGGAKSAEMSNLEALLVEKQSKVTDIEADIEANDTQRAEKREVYVATGTALQAAKTNYQTATGNYLAAAKELEELKSGNIFSTLLNTITFKISQAEKKVEELKKIADKAKADYEEAQTAREDAQEEYLNTIKEGMQLKTDRNKAQEEVTAVQQQIQELAKKEAGEKETQATEDAPEAPKEGEDGDKAATTSPNLTALQEMAKNNPELQEALNAYGNNITEADIAELMAIYNPSEAPNDNGGLPDAPTIPDEGAETTPDILADEELLKELLKQKEQEAQDYHKFHDIIDINPVDIGKFIELFDGGFSADEFRDLGLRLIDMVDEASKIYETKLQASAYSKSGAMASGDSATLEEHSKAQSEFTDAVLQVSDIVNNSDIEFYNVSDQSNFEIASNTLDRVNQGEYIKTDTLEKQTSAVKNIRTAEKTDTEAKETNDEKYQQFSDAILGELQDLISTSGGISQDEFNVIQTTFDLKASTDMKSAFDYLEEQARKHNITSAINKNEN